MTIREVAERLETKPVNVHKWRERGLFPNARQIPGLKIGRGEVWLIPESDIETFQKPKRGKPFSAHPSDLALAKRRSRANKTPNAANATKE